MQRHPARDKATAKLRARGPAVEARCAAAAARRRSQTGAAGAGGGRGGLNSSFRPAVVSAAEHPSLARPSALHGPQCRLCRRGPGPSSAEPALRRRPVTGTGDPRPTEAALGPSFRRRPVGLIRCLHGLCAAYNTQLGLQHQSLQWTKGMTEQKSLFATSAAR